MITAVLDILLMMGAIAAVVTIDGGKWVGKMVNEYNSQPSRWDIMALPSQNDSIAFPDAQTRPTGEVCRTLIPAGQEDWDLTNQQIALYDRTRGC